MPTPFTIGLLGPWGSGKTTVVGLLRKKIREKELKWVYLDVWKFARDPVKRWVLFETATQLGVQDALIDGRSLRDHLLVEEGDSTDITPSWRVPPATLRVLVSMAILATAALIAALILAQQPELARLVRRRARCSRWCRPSVGWRCSAARC